MAVHAQRPGFHLPAEIVEAAQVAFESEGRRIIGIAKAADGEEVAYGDPLASVPKRLLRRLVGRQHAERCRRQVAQVHAQRGRGEQAQAQSAHGAAPASWRRWKWKGPSLPP